MNRQELHPDNYRRIFIINLLLSLPLFILFSWPYLFISESMGIREFITYPGCVIFASPFVITILHGHATMALGELHRHHYYNWLLDHPLTYGLLFHPTIIRTRFRLVLLSVSVLFLIAGMLVGL